MSACIPCEQLSTWPTRPHLDCRPTARPPPLLYPETFLNGSARITGMVPDGIAVTEFRLETENFHPCYYQRFTGPTCVLPAAVRGPVIFMVTVEALHTDTGDTYQYLYML